MPSAKKAKKDAKEAGGVVAAVTKHASGKFTNGNAPGPASDTSSSANQSPSVEPVATPSSNGNPSISPILGAVPFSGAPSYAPSPRTIPGMGDWAPSRGGLSTGLAGSPGHLINLMGESPPSRWSSPRPYGTSHTSHTSHLSLASNGSHHTSVSVSPPMAGELRGITGRRPLSYHMDPAVQYPPVSQSSPQHPPHHSGTSPGHRRDSLHSHYAQSRGVAPAAAAAAAIPNPPLPHQPQAHFYGAPDIDIDLQSRQNGLKAGQRGYHFAFDTLPASHYQGGSAETVVTAGYEGGLEVHSVSKRGLDRLASLSGLRGGVVNAKILPWTVSSPALADAFPLVAVVVHGPVLPPAASPDAGQVEASDVPTDERWKHGRTADGKPGTVDNKDASPQHSPLVGAHGEFPTGRTFSGSALPIEYYQTSVEVYSLKLNRRICTLLEAPKIPLQIAVTSPIFQAPSPSGAFHIKADAGNIVISSAVTGECWLYRQMAFSDESDLPFMFVAKLWTTLQQSLKGDSNAGDAATEGERSRTAASTPSSSPRLGLKQPVLSLSGKWLAYCPATPSSQIALRAVVPVPVHGRAPGYSSMTPPHLPPTTADVDLPHTESVMNKIMRDATQELISGAKWVGQQGWQAFNNYWKGSPGTSAPQAPRSPPSSAYAGRLDGQFPPTHGGAAPAVVSKEPGLVSVIDITALGGSSTIHPITTFAPTLGCSFLSFSPTGLWLFIASTKGDVQTVWDLFRIQYTKASPLQAVSVPGSLTGPRVRQIAQFSRMTVARIVDVAWTKPNGERLAMVTERGTVHLLDLPSSAFTWPPPRRRGTRPPYGAGAAGPSSAGTDTAAGGTASTAVSYASNALTTAFDAARPLLTRPRRSSSNVPQSTGAIIADHASHGGKIIAAGISHSLGKTGNAISQLRHTGESRVSLPSGPFAPGPSCVAWVAGKRHHSLFVLGDGFVRHFVSRTRKKSSGQRVLHLGFNKDLRVPNLPDDLLSTAVQHYLDPEVFLDFVEQNDAGSNTMVLANHAQHPSVVPTAVESSIPHAEIESSAPYQPFHTDRRIALYEYDPLRQGALYAQSQSALIYPSSLPSHEPPTAEFSALTISPPTPALSTSPMDDDLLTAAPSVTGKSKSAKKQAKAAARAKQNEQSQDPEPSLVDTLEIETNNGNGNGHSIPQAPTKANSSWVFGLPIVSTLVDTGFPPMSEEESFNISHEETRALPASAIERVLEQVGGEEQIVVTTRRRRGGGRPSPGDPDDEDGFFEDDCEVLDFADQRV
ncbi:hypothetical protein SPBR_02201 [Sporothrix brasiliensis 5110]|uniref:Uncharacterized protein n=1 Tax=Sporothrix brasiliensis 5110 TaxID=1398154 RepID=A0A0C2FME1_9PEZI|nr:uncharacterized protein SPBR_02201 [Sporothrix brasiliensis 5110]KIH92218.1 hypothetical protein SPBR_02201 [Sporothrix brasiliensis 5110]